MPRLEQRYSGEIRLSDWEWSCLPRKEMMRSLVVQDGSLYYHLRTIGFSFG